MSKKGSLKSTLAVSLTNYLDAGAIVAGASGLTLWQNYLGLTEGHLGWLNAISANCLGAAIGAIIGGFLADKYGRKAIYSYNMLIYMTGVALVMLSFNFPMLLAGFLITGISVGVGVPASWTYISESSEQTKRGRNIAISQMAWGVGPFVILVLGMLFAPEGIAFGFTEKIGTWISGGTATGAALEVWSSRIVFFSLFVVALIAWLLQRRLDESQEWAAAKAKESTEKKGVFSSFGSLFTNKVNVRTVIFLAGIYLTWNMVASVMGFFQPHIYETAGGLSNADANMFSAGNWAIVIITTFFFSLIVDKVPHRLLYITGLVIAIAAWVMVAVIGVSSMTGLIIFTILWAVQGGVSVQAFYALWASELFPAKYRAAAQGIMFFLVRGICALWGLCFVYIYGENGQGFQLASYLMMGLLFISLVVGAIWAPKTQGKTLDQITKERYGDNF
ncbi:MAG: MFS transporter [Bacteroidales bacterium]|nr:MFS transporter [Bacteroidales bacterium]